MGDSAATPMSESLNVPEGTPTPSRRARGYSWPVWLAAVSGVVGQLLFSNDWCLYTVPAALLAAFVFWAFIAFTAMMSRSGEPPR